MGALQGTTHPQGWGESSRVATRWLLASLASERAGQPHGPLTD